MLQISKSAEYALLLLLNLKKNKAISLNQISSKKKLPFKYLEKVASLLKKAKLIKSRQGVQGGYFLAKRKAEISLQEIIKAVSGEKGLVSCLYGNCHLKKNCLHRHIWQKLQEKINKEFEKIKLKDLK